MHNKNTHDKLHKTIEQKHNKHQTCERNQKRETIHTMTYTNIHKHGQKQTHKFMYQ